MNVRAARVRLSGARVTFSFVQILFYSYGSDHEYLYLGKEAKQGRKKHEKRINGKGGVEPCTAANAP